MNFLCVPYVTNILEFCQHVDAECKADHMHPCALPGAEWKILDMPEIIEGPLEEADIQCLDNYHHDRFCKYDNVCLQKAEGKENNLLHIYSSKSKEDIIPKKKRDDWASDAWWLRYHSRSELPSNHTVCHDYQIVLEILYQLNR